MDIYSQNNKFRVWNKCIGWKFSKNDDCTVSNFPSKVLNFIKCYTLEGNIPSPTINIFGKFPPNTFIPHPTFILLRVNVHPIWLFHTLPLLGTQEYVFGHCDFKSGWSSLGSNLITNNVNAVSLPCTHQAMPFSAFKMGGQCHPRLRLGWHCSPISKASNGIARCVLSRLTAFYQCLWKLTANLHRSSFST